MTYTPCTDKECQHRYTIGTAAAHFTGWNEGYDAAQEATITHRHTFTPCTGTRCGVEIAATALNSHAEGFSDGYAAAVAHAHVAGFEWPAPRCERCGAGSLALICWDCSQKDSDSE